jgi:alpha-L-arabinofuranosidase
LYGELIQNRAFQGSSQDGQASTIRNLDFWHPIGSDMLILDDEAPLLSDALPFHMRADIAEGASGETGFWNEGFWGMNITTAIPSLAFLNWSQMAGNCTRKLLGHSPPL